jgi:RecA/RadA recombinase
MAINKALLDKIKKNSTIKETTILANSKFYNEKSFVDTKIPALNILLSGELNKGWTSGLTVWAADSKHFKTAFVLTLVKAYLDANEDSILLFYDSEFGAPPPYFKAFGIDVERVVHIPIKNIEELKFDLIKQLEEFDRNDKIAIMIDSVGNLASKKELDDALTENSAADMSRPKQLKGLWRMITPYLTIKDIPMAVINHTYEEQKMYGKTIMSGGKGTLLSADNVFFITKAQEKDKATNELVGNNFTVIAEKSRLIKERSKITFNVTFEGGINKWSGLLDIALESGHVIKPKMGWYARVLDGKPEDKSYREKDTNNEGFWKPILADQTFKQYVKDTFALGQVEMLQDKSMNEIVDELNEED